MAKKWSLFSRINFSKKKKGIPLSLEHRKALSRAKKGKPIKHFVNRRGEINKKISKALSGRKCPWLYGNKHGQWKGGRSDKRPDGYISSLIEIGTGKRMLEHRKIVEEYLGRKLVWEKKRGGIKEVVHHIDGNRKNNDIENLEIMSLSEHTRLHKLR